jgi:hypothetical protein
MFRVLPGITDSKPAQQLLVYIGTYTEKSSKGIYAFRLDTATGK